MKNYLSSTNVSLAIAVLVAVFSVNFVSADSYESIGASFTWNQSLYDFGKIEKDAPVTAEFSFQNTGDQPLMIMSTQASCGCTVAKYTKGEILPGEYGKVTATYNAAKVGAFSKTVTVNANTTVSQIKLQIKGEVVAQL